MFANSAELTRLDPRIPRPVIPNNYREKQQDTAIESDPVLRRRILPAMTAFRPYPELWNTLAHQLGPLRQLLAAAASEAFAAISAQARARLAHLTALVRRYIHILAAEIRLPPLQPALTDPSVPALPKGRRA